MSATTTSRDAAIAIALLVLGAIAGCAGTEVARFSEPAVHAREVAASVAWSRDLGRAAESPPVPSGTGWLVPITNAVLLHVRQADGAQVWKRKLSGPPVGPPLVLGEQVLVATDVPGFELFGLDLADGKVNWRQPLWGGRLARGGEELVVADRRGSVRRLDPADGDSLWSVEVAGSGWRDPILVPGLGLALIPTRTDSVIALDLGDGGRRWAVGAGSRPRIAVGAGHLVCFSEDAVIRTFSLETGAALDSLTVGGFPAGSPVVSGERLLVSTTRGEVRALDLPGLETRWTRQLDPPLRATPGLVGSLLLQPGPRGTVRLLDGSSGGDRGELALPELLIVSPVGEGDRVLVVGERGTATAFNLEEPR